MYAIIETGGKQYKVTEGSVIDVELLGKEVGSEIEFNQVLFIQGETSPKIGAPYIQGCTVVGQLVEETRGPKLINFKYKKRKNYRRKKGHKQRYDRVKITAIKG